MAEQVVGAKVRIDVNEEGSYEGYVHHIDQKSKKLTLVKVVSCTTGTRLHGLHYFFPNEITGLTVLEHKKKDTVKNNAVNNAQKNTEDTHVIKEESVLNLDEKKERELPQTKHQPNFSKKYLEKDKSRRDPSDEGLRLLQKKPRSQQCYSENFVESFEDRENFAINPPDVVMIDSFGETFEQAIAYISRQRVVGVAWEGHEVGRFGRLCLVQIGCNKRIYIFDIVTLGNNAFYYGLADILDSGDILKVMHNSRYFSDALFHQYKISLVNIFDTQVADAIIYKNEDRDGKFPRQTSSLMSCLYEFLDLSPDQYHFHKVRLKHVKNDEMVWINRPLHKDLIDVVAKSVMYLRELRLAQMERMMEEFIQGVDIYLSCIRDASDEVVRKKSLSAALPQMFYEFRNRRKQSRCRTRDLEKCENEEQREAWEEGHKFIEMYEQRGMRLREHKYPAYNAGQSSPSSNDLSPNNSYSNNLAAGVAKLNMFEQTTKVQQERRNPGSANETKGRESPAGIFSHEDFPQLSSDSDSGGCSPSGVHHIKATRDPRFGRGRAQVLIRNAQMPYVRQPREKQYDVHSPAGFSQHNRLQFPPDEELLNSPEVIAASSLSSIPSGPRVRISHQ